MDTFYEPLLELEAFGQIREQLKKEEGLQLITGCVDSQKTHLMYSLGRDWPVKLILTYNELKAKEIYEEYEALGEDVYYYPARDFLFFQADIQGNELLRQRGHRLLAQREDRVQVRECLSPCLAGKAVDGHLGPERL